MNEIIQIFPNSKPIEFFGAFKNHSMNITVFCILKIKVTCMQHKLHMTCDMPSTVLNVYKSVHISYVSNVSIPL